MNDLDKIIDKMKKISKDISSYRSNPYRSNYDKFVKVASHVKLELCKI